MGVLQVRNKRTGQAFIFGVTNLEGKVNGIRAQLASGSFMDKGFQKDFDAAPDELELIVLEVVNRDKSPVYDYIADLKLLAKKWTDEASEAVYDVCVYGTGGVGGYFGARLVLAEEPGVRVTLIARNAGLAAIRSNGLELTSPDGQRHIARPYLVTDDVGEAPAPDLVLLCVKAYDLAGATQALAPVVADRTVIMPLLNGVDIFDRVRAGLPHGIVLPATVTISVHVSAPGQVTYASGQGIIITGEDPAHPGFKPDEMLNIFERAGLPVEWSADPLNAIWTKFIFIAPFGLVTSAHDKTIGEVMADPELADQTRQIMCEIKAIADAKGIYLPANIIEATFDKAGAFPYDTKTSLQRDVEQAGKPNELQLFGGAIMRLGIAIKIPTPATITAFNAAIRHTSK